MIRKLFILLFIILPTSFDTSSAEDIGILFDVSKSMKNEWLQEGKKAISELVIYGLISQGWELSSAKEEYEFLVQHRSPVDIGNTVMLLEFGTVIDTSFPYFRKPKWIKINDRNELQQFIDLNSPIEVRDNWTFELLAEATASKIFRDSIHSQEWFLIVLSDFKEDRGFLLTDEQVELVDKYETQVDVSFFTELIFRWKKNNNLQLKILKVSTGGKKYRAQKRNIINLLAPEDGFEFESKKGKNVTFSWRWIGDQNEIEKYGFVLRKKERKGYKLVQNRSLSRTRFTYHEQLESGQFEWYVRGHSKQGPVISAHRTFVVKGGSILPWLLSVIILFGGVLGFLRYGLPKIQRMWRRRDEF